jgi:hypothetical protein
MNLHEAFTRMANDPETVLCLDLDIHPVMFSV